MENVTAGTTELQVQLDGTRGDDDGGYRGFFVGQGVIIGPGTAQEETNTIRALRNNATAGAQMTLAMQSEAPLENNDIIITPQVVQVLTMEFETPLQNDHVGFVVIEGVPEPPGAGSTDEDDAHDDMIPLALALAVPGIAFLVSIIAYISRQEHMQRYSPLTFPREEEKTYRSPPSIPTAERKVYRSRYDLPPSPPSIPMAEKKVYRSRYDLPPSSPSIPMAEKKVYRSRYQRPGKDI